MMEVQNEKQSILLSIGIIVKDGAGTLRQCLDSLEPIRKAIACQLIITDTGSVDQTIEIAREYTQEVYSFPWCNDFAAARNVGLEKARGAWFMYIDADEWFADANGIIDFFENGMYRSYDVAIYPVRSYVNRKQSEKYIENLPFRLFKMRKDIMFSGKIHESINSGNNLFVIQDAYAYHTGYELNNGSDFLEKKSKRNIMLLKEAVKEEPDDLRLCWHLAQEYPIYLKTEEHAYYIHKGFQLLSQNKNSFYCAAVVRDEAICLYLEGKKEAAAKVIQTYFELHTKEVSMQLDMAFQMMIICIDQENYQEALSWIDTYHSLYESVRKGVVSPADMAANVMTGSESHFQKSILMKALCVYKQAHVEEACELVKQMNIQIIESDMLEECIAVVVEIGLNAKAYHYLVELHQSIATYHTKELEDSYENELEQQMCEKQEERQEICEVFCKEASVKVMEDYVQLQWVRKMLGSGDKSLLQGIKSMKSLIRCGKIQDPIYADIIYAAMWHGERVDDIIETIEVDDFSKYTPSVGHYITTIKGEMLQLIENACVPQQEQQSLKMKYFLLCAMEHILLPEPLVTEKAQFFDAYITLGIQYIRKIYSVSILNEAQISILPRSYRFFYYAGQALEFRIKDFKQYAVYMKKALEQSPFFSELVQNSLEAFEAQLHDGEQKSTVAEQEFAIYARTVKEKIAYLIQQGMRSEATQLIDAYQKINPIDTDGVAVLKSLLENENTFQYKN
ncbi:MAG: glycosyltransferase family 2 protein [Lachnospiraceae bacterium]